MPSRKHNLITLHWSEGSGKNLAKNKNFAGHWSQFWPKFQKPFVTPEKRKAFRELFRRLAALTPAPYGLGSAV